MAGADYRHCDQCGCKAFYDANLNYQFSTVREPIDPELLVKDSGHKLDYLGDWAVLCTDCAKTHECIIRPKEPA